MPLASEHLALLVLAFDRARRAGVQRLLPSVGEVGDLVFHRHGHEVTPSPRAPRFGTSPASAFRAAGVLEPPRSELRNGSGPSMDGGCRFTTRDMSESDAPMEPSAPAADRTDAGQARSDDSRRATTTGCSSRSGTDSDASCSATAIGSSSSPASSSRSPDTSPSCWSRSSGRCRSAASSTARSWCPTAAITDSTSMRSCSGSIPPSRGSTASPQRPPRSSSRSISSRSGTGPRSTTRCSPDVRCSSTRSLENERVRLTPASTDRARAEEWFDAFEGAGLDGVIAKPVAGTYAAGKRALIKVKHVRTADCAVPGYRIHKDGNGVGSLLLGLYDADGEMRSVGVAASFSVKRRAELLDELSPRTGPDALVDHPWIDWATWQEEQQAARTANEAAGTPTPPSAGSRWNAGKDLSFVPIAHGARRRGHVRPARRWPVPTRCRIRPVAARPFARIVSLRPARRGRTGAVLHAVLTTSRRADCAGRSGSERGGSALGGGRFGRVHLDEARRRQRDRSGRRGAVEIEHRVGLLGTADDAARRVRLDLDGPVAGAR